MQLNGIIKTLKTDVIYNKHKPKQCEDPFQRLTVNKIIIMILLIIIFFFLCILCRLSLFHENEINAPVTCEQKLDERKRKAIVN